jgi:hypothetical protein
MDEQTFTEATMRCLEEVRDSGMCNMIDRRCVGDAADMVCEDVPAELTEITAARRAPGWMALLQAFGAWKAKGDD